MGAPRCKPTSAGGSIVTWVDFCVASSDIYVMRVMASGDVDPSWPAHGRGICTATNFQEGAVIVMDGSGGAIIAWQDFRSGSQYDIYAMHVLSSGLADPGWPTNGRALCTATGDQYAPAIVSDGSGGAIVTWRDGRGGSATDIYAQRVLATGAVDPAWPVNGRAVCTASGAQLVPSVVTDGGGGAIVAWADNSGANTDVYAQRVLVSGVVDPNWPVNGRAVGFATGTQQNPAIVADGSSGAILAWEDNRAGAGFDIYAQHVFSYGVLDVLWPAEGQLVCDASGGQSTPVAAADGTGGAFVAWQDPRGSSTDIYTHHVLASGALDFT